MYTSTSTSLSSPVTVVKSWGKEGVCLIYTPFSCDFWGKISHIFFPVNVSVKIKDSFITTGVVNVNLMLSLPKLASPLPGSLLPLMTCSCVPFLGLMLGAGLRWSPRDPAGEAPVLHWSACDLDLGSRVGAVMVAALLRAGTTRSKAPRTGALQSRPSSLDRCREWERPADVIVACETGSLFFFFFLFKKFKQRHLVCLTRWSVLCGGHTVLGVSTPIRLGSQLLVANLLVGLQITVKDNLLVLAVNLPPLFKDSQVSS